VDFVSRFTERIGSRAGRESGAQNVKRKEETGTRGWWDGRKEKKEERKKGRTKRGPGGGGIGGYGGKLCPRCFGIVIHRPRISNYNDGRRSKGGRGGRAVLPPSLRPRVPVLRPCEKFARTRTGLVDGGDSGGVAAPCYPLPAFPPSILQDRAACVWFITVRERGDEEGAGRGFNARGPAKLFFSRNRYEPTTILSHPHRSPTVEVALADAKVAASVVVDGVDEGRSERIRERSRSESNSSGASRRLNLEAVRVRRQTEADHISRLRDLGLELATRLNPRGARELDSRCVQEAESPRALRKFPSSPPRTFMFPILFFSLYLVNSWLHCAVI